MGLIVWYEAWKKRAETERHQLAAEVHNRAIIRLAPEIAGMSTAGGKAYVLGTLRFFQEAQSPFACALLKTRVAEAQRCWQAQGLEMPYWATLTVLRGLQADIAAQEIWTRYLAEPAPGARAARKTASSSGPASRGGHSPPADGFRAAG